MSHEHCDCWVYHTETHEMEYKMGMSMKHKGHYPMMQVMIDASTSDSKVFAVGNINGDFLHIFNNGEWTF